MTIFSRSIELFLIDGNADGMLTAGVWGWTGHILKFPRQRLPEALKRKEAHYSGVYILISAESGQKAAYIGEAENVAERIKTHDAKLDWWESAVLLTTTNDALHKAHIKYLESRFFEISKSSGRFELRNANTPTKSSLGESDTSNMESFIETVELVLPALGVDIFKKDTRPETPAVAINSDEKRFTLSTPKNNVDATAALRNGEFVVLKGSKVRARWGGKDGKPAGYKKIHDSLVARKLIVIDEDGATLKENYAFSSPSAAAAVVNGRSTDGRLEWIEVASGLTYGEFERKQLESETIPE